MILSTNAQKIYTEICNEGTKLGDLRKLATAIQKNHPLAIELWATGKLFPRLLAILIMDKKDLRPEVIDNLFNDIQNHRLEEQTQLTDWLMTNQLTKDKKTIELINTWGTSTVALQRRVFWYNQGRLRKNCHPDYLPDFIATEMQKRDL